MLAKRRQHRAAAIILVLIAGFTAMLCAIWLDATTGVPLLPIVIGYYLFSFGYLYSIVTDEIQTKGALVGIGAVMLNLLAMLLSALESIWIVLSLSAVAFALAGAIFHLVDARQAGA